MNEQKFPGQPSMGQWNWRDRWDRLRRRAPLYRRRAERWLHLHGRRVSHQFHNAVAGNRAAGPVTFLAGSAALAVALTLTTLYSPSYAVTLDGEPVGVVAASDEGVIQQAIQTVEKTGASLLGYDYQIEGELDYEFALTLRSELTPQEEIQDYFYQKLDSVSGELRNYQVSVDGLVVGAVKDQDALDSLLDQMKAKYTNENTVSAEFLDTVSVEPVYEAESLMTMSEMEAALQSNQDGSTTYTVVAGDTFYGIAYANDMSLSDLQALNPQMDINRLMVGDVLNVKELTPILSVQTVEEQTYTQTIACPVEEVEDSSLYVGDSRIITQGVEGEEQVNATVTYVNGQESGRTINSTTTLREPTTTVKAVGTKEKPKTASTGHYQWPIYGRISSYFGGRYIFGSYSYHSGIDIVASYGAAICAADGGTVTYAGYKGSYGNLVIITHDNGTQTYYGHNSSLTVSVGQKVYKGQQIARAGSTGRSTGPHCHFEVRVNGTSVNPLSYLP